MVELKSIREVTSRIRGIMMVGRECWDSFNGVKFEVGRPDTLCL